MCIEDFIRKIEDEFDDLNTGLLNPDSRYKEMLIASKTIKDIYEVIENRKMLL